MNKIFCKTCKHDHVGSVLEETGWKQTKMSSQWVSLQGVPQSGTQNSEFWLEKRPHTQENFGKILVQQETKINIL